MAAHDGRLLDALLRQDFHSFLMKAFFTLNPGERYLPNWHLQALCWHLEQVRLGKIKRLRIEVPPRSLKSVSASVAFPAFLLGHDPGRKIITASYSADLAAKHAADCRAVMRSDWYRRLFPGTRISETKNQESNYETTRRGYRYATSIGGTLTGRGGDLIIIDDPLKPEDAMRRPGARRSTAGIPARRCRASTTSPRMRSSLSSSGCTSMTLPGMSTVSRTGPCCPCRPLLKPTR